MCLCTFVLEEEQLTQKTRKILNSEYRGCWGGGGNPERNDLAYSELKHSRYR